MIRVLAIVLLCVGLAACASAMPVPPELSYEASKAGFWWGLWNGSTVVPAAIGMALFDHSIALYHTPNSGGWYDFGYVLGVMGFLWGAVKLVFGLIGKALG